MNPFQVFAAAKFIPDFAQQQNYVALVLEPLGCDVFRVVDQSQHADRRRRVNRARGRFVVEADVATGDRRIECLARFANAFHATAKLPEHFRLHRVAEVEVVGDGQWPCSATDQVAHGFRHGNLAALKRIEIAVGRIAIGCECDELLARRTGCAEVGP